MVLFISAFPAILFVTKKKRFIIGLGVGPCASYSLFLYYVVFFVPRVPREKARKQDLTRGQQTEIYLRSNAAIFHGVGV